MSEEKRKILWSCFCPIIHKFEKRKYQHAYDVSTFDTKEDVELSKKKCKEYCENQLNSFMGKYLFEETHDDDYNGC
jgi:hypothetical protein